MILRFSATSFSGGFQLTLVEGGEGRSEVVAGIGTPHPMTNGKRARWPCRLVFEIGKTCEVIRCVVVSKR